MRSFERLFDEIRKEIERRISKYLPKGEPREIYEPFSYIMAEGGKRIRPVLTVLACGAVGGDIEKAFNPAVAIEILHNFTLAHDDIMDRSPMRRNRLSVYKKWDEATAILCGDVMIGYAYALLPSLKDSPKAGEIFEEFNKALIEVC